MRFPVYKDHFLSPMLADYQSLPLIELCYKNLDDLERFVPFIHGLDPVRSRISEVYPKR